MVKNFLKIAGVKTQSEFYKKYPSEEAFFRAHPEAQHLVHQKMAYGGINAYRYGGYPTYQGDTNGSTVAPPLNRGAYADNEEQYQADMDAYLQNLKFNSSPSSASYPLPAAGASGLPDYLRVSNVPAVSSAAATTQQHVTLNPYQGASVYDMLTAQGKAGDYKSRKSLAKTLGIANYKGTKDQNALLMNLIKQNPDALSNYTGASDVPNVTGASSPQFTDADYANYYNQQASQNPYIMAPGTPPVPKPNGGWGFLPPAPGGSSSKGVPLGVAIGAGALTAAGALGSAAEIKSMINKMKSGQYLTGQAKAKITAYRNEFRNKMLKEAGANIKKQAEWFEKLPKEQQEILKNLDAMEIPGDMHIMPHGTAARDLYTRDMLNEAHAEDMLTNTNDALREAEEEAKIIRSANARKAAAARWGTKAAETEKALGLGDKLMNGLRTFGEMKYVKPVAEFFRGAREVMPHRYGGEDSGTYMNGVYFQDGGFIPDYSYAIGGEPCYNCGGGMYQAGGSYYPMPQQPGTPLPKFMYGMKTGGLVKGSVHDMSQDQIQDLINQGYKIEYV